MTCAVYFNLDDTLTEMTRDFEEIYHDAVEQAGLDELEDRYEDYTDRFFDHFNDGYAFPRRQAIEQLSRDEDCFDPDKVEDFAEAWDDLESDATELKDGAEQLLDSLDDYRLGILSNGTGELQQKKLEKTGIADYFDSVLISGKEGYRKPEKAFYQLAMDGSKGGIDADTHVMVSDKLKRDVIPAKKAGFEGVWIYSGDKEVPDKLRKQVSVVKGFDGAKEAIDRLCS